MDVINLMRRHRIPLNYRSRNPESFPRPGTDEFGLGIYNVHLARRVLGIPFVLDH